MTFSNCFSVVAGVATERRYVFVYRPVLRANIGQIAITAEITDNYPAEVAAKLPIPVTVTESVSFAYPGNAYVNADSRSEDI